MEEDKGAQRTINEALWRRCYFWWWGTVGMLMSYGTHQRLTNCYAFIFEQPFRFPPEHSIRYLKALENMQ